ncbi:Cytochrome P450 [Popillia japonica]|uniref:Cytochrome P450 n=1 Tax=Popillia japonica TaxID=7064 RepID=A0AAW1K525_POPJA
MIRKLRFKHGLRRLQFPRKSVSKTKEIPSPKGLPVIGTTLSLIAAGSAPKLHQYIDGRHKELGPIFRDKIGPVSAIFVSDPDYMRAVFNNEGKHPIHVLPEPWMVYNKIHGCTRGLFFMNGEEWLETRKKMNKFLLKGDLKWLEDSVKIATEDLVEKIKNISHGGASYIPNLEPILYRWSLDVMVSILVGAKNFGQVKKLHQSDLEHLAKTVHLIFHTTSELQLIPANLAYHLRLSRWKMFENSVTTALTTANNFVSRILNETIDENSLISKMLRENLQEDLIIRIITDLVLAAGDTTAYSMEWILYLMSKHPKIQTQLYNELQSNPNTPLTKNIVRESLRLYPVAPFLTRFLPEDTNIDGYEIPKNTLVILSIYTSGRDPKYFENPAEFQPDRWVRDHGGNFKQMIQATMPFAIGARSCIGRKIAEIQLQMALNEIIRKFSVVSKNEEDVEMILKMVAVPSKLVKLEFCELQSEADVTEVVAIKVLKETATREAEEDFLREVDIMSAFRHSNILSLLGVVLRDAGVSPMMVFEYMPHGDLAEVLRAQKKRHATEENVPILTSKDLLSIALQIASGMRYLAAQRFVHRDLACRNCLVSAGPTVKIADFGMSRDVYTCDYYKIGGSRLLPVRWMSPESVIYGRFTLESDIWSYGVILWEIYSFGKQPYYGHTNEEVVKLILEGIMLIPPEDTPSLICELMQLCWKTEPRDRIRFSDIYAKLEKAHDNFVGKRNRAIGSVSATSTRN